MEIYEWISRDSTKQDSAILLLNQFVKITVLLENLVSLKNKEKYSSTHFRFWVSVWGIKSILLFHIKYIIKKVQRKIFLKAIVKTILTFY